VDRGGFHYYPLPRQGHVSVLHNNNVFIFGGRTDGENKQRKYLNDTWVYSLEDKAWTKIKHEGPALMERWNHTAVLYDNCMWVFGGQTDSGYTNELLKLDLETRKWLKVESKGTPSARHGHSCCVWQAAGQMVLFGGRDGYQPAHFANDFWLFDFTTLVWSQVHVANPPSGRYYHDICIAENTLYSFGGYFWDEKTRKEHYFSDLYSLELSKAENSNLTWTCLHRSPHPLIHPRNRCCFAVLTANWLVLYGGNSYEGKRGTDLFYSDIFVFNTTTLVWKKVPTDSSEIPQRGQATCFVKDKGLYVIGGEKKRKRWNDIYVFNFN